MKKRLLSFLFTIFLIIPVVHAFADVTGEVVEQPKDEKSISASFAMRYSVSDMEFKKSLLAVNLIPKKFEHVDFITLVGTEDDNLVGEDAKWRAGLGARTDFEALKFSDDVRRIVSNLFHKDLPEGLDLGPNLNPYFVVDPAETLRRLFDGCDFDEEYFRDYTDGGFIIEFVRYTYTF